MTPNWTTDRPTKPGEYWLAVHIRTSLLGFPRILTPRLSCGVSRKNSQIEVL